MTNNEMDEVRNIKNKTMTVQYGTISVVILFLIGQVYFSTRWLTQTENNDATHNQVIEDHEKRLTSLEGRCEDNADKVVALESSLNRVEAIQKSDSSKLDVISGDIIAIKTILTISELEIKKKDN
jgi:predicted RNase H-like nuclease (RuvC/YqgF family)